MAPKVSYVLFSRLTKSDFAILEDIVGKLVEMEARRPIYVQDVVLLGGELKVLHETLLNRLEAYTSLEELPEGVTEDLLQAATTKLNDLHLKGELIVNRLSNPTPMACSTAINPHESSYRPDQSSMLSSSELPRLSLPVFDGDPSKFAEFYSKFVTLVHDNICLTAKQKLLYLLSHLKDSAHEKISLLPVNDENYEVARKLLVDRYQNVKIQTRTFCHKLLQLPRVNLNSHCSMRDLVDLYNLNFASLKSLGVNNIYESIYCTYILSHLEAPLRERFEAYYNKDNLPSVSDIISFLTNLAEQKESMSYLTNNLSYQNKTSSNPTFGVKSKSKFPKNSSLTVSCDKNSCCLCEGRHKISDCPKFLNLSPKERYKVLKSRKICVACLEPKHFGICAIPVSCDKCSAATHHSKLHFGDSKPISVGMHCDPPGLGPSNCMSVTTSAPNTVLMATCLIRLQVNSNQFLILRAILDTASQLSFITENCAQRLGVKRYQESIQVCGIGGTTSPRTKGACNLAVMNLSGITLAESHKFHIISQISQATPRMTISSEVREAAKNFVLADSTFGQPSRVDALLGADVTSAALNGPVIPLGKGLPVAVSTYFGYVLMGSAPIALHSALNEGNNSFLSEFPVPSPGGSSCLLSGLAYPIANYMPTCLVSTVAEGDLAKALNRFWELEELPPVAPCMSEEDQRCEDFYVSSTFRLESGRYVVRLPFKDDFISLLGHSYGEALSRFRSLENKFSKNPEFKSSYVEFMRDYIAQEHMCPIDISLVKYFMPHHGIFKRHGDTQKIRVVFAADSKTSTGYSLNDVLFTGPRLQSLISDILTLFRRFTFVICSDVQQMFRQILVHESDCVYQCILWREDPNDPIIVYALKTVTYGLTCAPFLAIRTLYKLAHDEQKSFPLASKAILENFFVDDFAGGANTTQQAQELIRELISLLGKGGFNLKKWATNYPGLLNGLTDEENTEFKDAHGVLGIIWNPVCDVLKYPIHEMLTSQTSNLTKRVVMAQTAKLYDPCGWIAPVVMRAKCFMQTLWKSKLSWDAVLTPDLASVWLEFVSSLKDLSVLEIPRSLHMHDGIQLHGFADASLAGFSALLYVRCVRQNEIICSLLTSKTRVAPLRPLTIPRMELQGAHLLAKLTSHYNQLLKSHVRIESIHLWTDSTIVLAWVNTPPHLLRTFVANRVSQILEYTAGVHWHHVAGQENPADLASRGLDAVNFLQNIDFWLKGPFWLSKPSEFWPINTFSAVHDPVALEYKAPDNVLLTEESSSLFSNFSSWRFVVRVSSLIIRWIPRYKKLNLSEAQWRELGHDFVMRHIQLLHFKKEISEVRKGKSVRLAIARLAPYIDDFGLLRGRGRLSHSAVFEGKPPIILPKNDHLVILLIRHTHMQLGHAGCSQVRYQLSLQYWILAARQVIRSVLFKCTICFRANPRNSPPLMADLPCERVNPAPVFYNTGMDYCGPFLVRSSTLRKAPFIKCYICVFICMAVKAVHLELAVDLSTDAFIDVLKRFISRRGCPKRLFSDCGTNFIGANRALQKDLRELLSSSEGMLRLFALDNKIEFKFLPSSSPFMGGLWERAVRSTKYHLTRVIGAQVLTFYQLNSIVIQVEGILNSRPLTAIPAEPGDCQVLTPGHFIIGRALTTPPEPDLMHLKDATLGHYQLIQSMLQRFWAKWRQEYLSALQSRAKWTKSCRNLEIGDVVVLEEPNCAPCQWPLGRITQVFPAKDGVVRKAEVSTATGTYLRPAVRLYPLPLGNY